MAAAAAGRVAQAGFYLAYPLVVYWSVTRLSVRGVGAALLLLYGLAVLLRGRARAESLWPLLRQHLPVVAFIAAATLSDERRLLLLQPAVVSLYLFATFAWTLRRGPSMHERIGRAWDPHFADFLRGYCRRMTVLWCGFFLLNAGIVVVLGRAAPLGWWALYTGVVSYVLIGLLVAGDACLRRWWFRHYGDGALDRVFARLFPAEDTAAGRRSLAYAAARRPPPLRGDRGAAT